MEDSNRKNKALHTCISILINLLILLGLAALFYLSFDFAYKVFANDVYDPGSTRTVVINIEESDTADTIAKELEDQHIIENKLAFSLRVRFSRYNGKIKAGTYEVSAGMSTDEILAVFSGDELQEQEE